MPDFKAPGVFIQEVSTRANPIAGVPTSTVGFLGQTEWGTTVPQTISSWSEYKTIFGNHVPDISYLSYAVQGFFDNGGQRCWVGRIAPNGTATIADYRVGLEAFAKIDDISMMVIPDDVRDGLRGLSAELIQRCESAGRFAIVSAEQNPSSISALHPPHPSENAAFYYPWIKIQDSRSNTERWVPPAGHVAGIYAKTDNRRGVWKAPANVQVVGALDVKKRITAAEQDILNPRGVNCIRDFRSAGRGIVVWGARTMSSNPEWRYVPVRRLYLHIEESIKQGTEWVVFEPNDEPLWDSVQQSVSSFLTSLWRNGALQGTKPSDSFFVKCDRTTMTQNDLDNGRLNILIGFAPLKPAEFVVMKISHKINHAA